MMAYNTSYVDVRSKLFGGSANTPASMRGFLSPKIHVAGEIPPDLSPLDAFAAQSRLLAQQLEEKSYGENRISRLSTDIVVNPLNQDKSEYLNSLLVKSSDERPLSPTSSPSSGQKTKIEAPMNRHLSIHPTVCGPYDVEEDEIDVPSIPNLTQFEENKTRSIRPISPEYSEGCFSVQIQHQTPPSPQSSPTCLRVVNKSHDSHGQFNESTQKSNVLARIDLNESTTYDPLALDPKDTTFAHRSPSPYSLSTESSDEDYNLSKTRMTPLDINLSGNVNISTSFSSTSHLGRTSSISSDASFSATRIPKRYSPFNFSRPLTRKNAPEDLPIRQTSPDSSRSSSLPADETENMPNSTQSETFSDTSIENNPAPSYVYAKYALPRGKTLKRNSVIFEAPSLAQNSPNSPSHHESAPCSPLIRPAPSSLGQKASHNNQIPSPSIEIPRPSTSSSTINGLFDPNLLLPEELNLNKEALSKPKLSTEIQSTQKVILPRPSGSSSDLSATEHVDKAIEYHQAGVLNKSTYHLRLAARMSHPTGMLLYALACRHGWGMRPNPREGIIWLRKAADEVGIKIANDENSMLAGEEVDLSQMNSKRAQFALSIYELGVSHMNGWGIEQDKALGLRCFEIAGSWGDADAMAEAGFCYAQGVGCKKDLKKSARFYRMAEAKGINMIGNSWIYKAKYNDDPKTENKTKESDNGRGRSSTSSSKDAMKLLESHNKSRSRGIFRRSKAT
ncbi:putative cell cycle inhibitor nif1 [Erysiphe neolycopersici]|uniref:Putative cell cycle inhibitor nif1 n=1 Tax=Erysiphe neolycopersici TaxID=212602 RepID=A0A420HKY1_9PEZI|nr:putative cell cycle inhibitor nif1 [Erysiphe neolycopersici]